jgi:hypothetical protein
MLDRVLDAPVVRHPFAGLLLGAWERRANLRLADALYVELAESLSLSLLQPIDASGRCPLRMPSQYESASKACLDRTPAW